MAIHWLHGPLHVGNLPGVYYSGRYRQKPRVQRLLPWNLSPFAGLLVVAMVDWRMDRVAVHLLAIPLQIKLVDSLIL